MTDKKPASMLTPNDIQRFPVWRYTYSDEETGDETIVAPVEKIPVFDLAGCIVGARLSLNNGELVWGTLSNIDLRSAFRTKQFLVLSIFYDNLTFHVARYYDVDYERRSPDRLAEVLKMPIEWIFPISYDISRVAMGDEEILISEVHAQPERRLSKDELMDLALGNEV